MRRQPGVLTAPAAALVLLLASEVGGKDYAKTYTFMADRSECDGQCTYCRHAHNHRKWSEIRTRIGHYVYMPKEELATLPGLAEHQQVQELINWSWIKGTNYECILGIIALRLLSFGYSDPMQFVEDTDFDVLDWLDTFNQHTGALDLLTSSWAALLGGGWPVFKQLGLVSKKLIDMMDDKPMKYPTLQERPNECDQMDSDEDIAYRDAVIKGLEDGEFPAVGVHLLALRRRSGCPVGTAIALLSVALDMIRNRGMYQGSMKDVSNLVYAVIVTAQDTLNSWVKTKPNWSPFFDLFTTKWPLWDMLSELACVDTTRPCVTRSALQCFDPVRRMDVPCPHDRPKSRSLFVGCGEHDICTWPDALGKDNGKSWCVAHDHRPLETKEPWMLSLNHDQEERVCAQCGQDGVLRAIFHNIGFRPDVGLASAGKRPPFFVEFGARKPGMLNSAVLREFCGWDGILMDSQPGETPHGGCPTCPGVAEIVRTEFVTAENVNQLFEKHGVPRDFDLLTIDTDYNDYWIWRALLVNGSFRPRVVAVDFNPDLDLDVAKVVQYDAAAEWDGSVYTVGSLLGYALMARAHGYSFAYALEMGSHAFFVRSDLLHEEDRDLPLRNVKKNSHPPDSQKRQFVDVLYDFIPGRHSQGQAGRASSNQSADLAKGQKETAAPSELAALRLEVRSLAAEVRQLKTLLQAKVEPQTFTVSAASKK